TTPGREYSADLFPVNRIFQSAEWRQAYNKHWTYAPEKIQLYDAFEREVIKRFEQYQVPVIELKKQTPKEAVCLVFERVNTGGVVRGPRQGRRDRGRAPEDRPLVLVRRTGRALRRRHREPLRARPAGGRSDGARRGGGADHNPGVELPTEPPAHSAHAQQLGV